MLRLCHVVFAQTECILASLLPNGSSSSRQWTCVAKANWSSEKREDNVGLNAFLFSSARRCFASFFVVLFSSGDLLTAQVGYCCGAYWILRVNLHRPGMETDP